MWYQPNYFLDDSEISSAAEHSASIRGTVACSTHASHARRFNAGQSTQVVHEVHSSGTVALAMSPTLPQLSAEAVMGEFLAVLLMGSLFGVIHYRNFYWRSRWEKMTTGLR